MQIPLLRVSAPLMATRAILVSVVTLATVASCAASNAPGRAEQPSPSLATAETAKAATTTSPRPSPTATPALGVVLGPMLDIASPCNSDRAYVTTGTVVWQGCDLSATPLSSQIYEYSRQTGRTSLLYEAAGAGMTIRGVSEDWIVWSEYGDIFTVRDSTLYALRRGDRKRILLDDWHDHPKLAQLSDATLDGADVYWTVPRIESGAWHGTLVRRHLPDGDTIVVVQAPVGAIIGYPSVSGGVIAFEYSVETGTPITVVRYLTAAGVRHDLGAAASSEPTVGDGFIVFKRSERYEVGELASYVLATGVETPLGAGEQPRAQGPFVTWLSAAPLGGGMRLGRPLDNCIVKFPHEITESWPALGGGFFAWAFRDDARPAAEARRFRIAEIRSVRC